MNNIVAIVFFNENRAAKNHAHSTRYANRA
jgi:hypothetical protein